jgi:hypothetical protein
MRSALHIAHRLDPVSIKGWPAAAAQPEPRRVRVWVSTSLAQVSIQRPGRLDAEWDRPVPGTAAPARLAGDEHDPVPQVDVGDLEAGPQVGIRQDRRLGIARSGCPDPGRGVVIGLALAQQPAAAVPDPGEPPSGRVAGVSLPDLDQPAPDVLTVQLGRPHLGMALSQPVGQLRTAFWYALTVLSA